MRVFEEASCTIREKPTGRSSTNEIQKMRDRENRIRLVPNPPHANMIQVLSPRSPLLPASVTAPKSAPTPEKPSKRPSPCAPPCRICSAKIGIKVDIQKLPDAQMSTAINEKKPTPPTADQAKELFGYIDPAGK